MNWNVFAVKYDKREQWAFENMSYFLFCAEMDCRIGLFGFKNQVGIEKEPIEKNGVFYGFQAKYYTTPISQNKNDIIDSIRKAKNKNPQLNIIYLYTNQEFSESKKSNKKKSQYQIDIEAEAKKVNVKIEWRVPSHFEIQLSLPENKYIHDLFFELNPNLGDLIEEVKKHNTNILRAIQTEIIFNDSCIKIDRNDIIFQIEQYINNLQHIIISGEGGCGKTAIFKEFYERNKQQYPICIFKANELNFNNINDIFRFDHNFSFNQFFETYQSETTKVFVIDSAERLLEFNNTDILNDLIQRLKEEKWIIIFITRYSYLDVLNFMIKDIYHLSYGTIDIPLLNSEELNNLSENYNFTLPENPKFTERLQNLFYLNEYIQELPNIDKKGNFRSFVNLIWKKRIQNFSHQKENIHIERENCFIYVVKERCRTGLFYINADKFSQSVLLLLKQDELLGYDENFNGYFITHDIYEEWALEKIISRCYVNYTNSKQFFDELGDSLPIRRAFRLWLSEQLSENVDTVKEFINDTFTNDTVLQHWKDELIVSVLLSDYADVFFTQFEKEIIANDFEILNRILFLLQIACKEEDNTLRKLLKITDADYTFTKPRGKGWKVAIAFIYKHKELYFENHLKLVIPILTDWVNSNKEGKTTRFAGLLALSLIKQTETTENYLIHKKSRETISKIIYNSAEELQIELQHIFDKVIANKWINHNAPYEEFCSMILEQPIFAIETIKVLPLSIIQLCDLFWQKRKKDVDCGFCFDRNDMESKYGVANLNYFPASALQTPIYWLLQFAFKETLDFIIDFTNRAVEYYRKSDYGKEDVGEIILHINNEEVKQYSCFAFWGMYRGVGNPAVPYLLQSMHMALEKVLLHIASSVKNDNVEYLLQDILIKSKSTSLTAIVCSIVLANPNKFYNIALILFRTIELFHIDSNRQIQEYQAKSLYGIGYGLNQDKKAHADERLKTCEDEHRNSSLEFLFLNYQFSGIKDFTDEQNTNYILKLYEIIDKHKIAIEKKDTYKNNFGILLARMDRRNLSAEVTKQDDNNFIVEFTPKNLSDELKEQSEQVTKQIENTFKYNSLRLWADFMHNRNSSSQNKYDINPLLALKETKDCIKELQEGRAMGILDYSTPAFACSKLIIEHKDKLNIEEKDFCKNVIIEYISQLFSDDYEYQISDGVEAAIHAMPSLMAEYQEEKENFIIMMVLALFDKTPIGAYKRICDYVIESIHESKLWKNASNNAQAILLWFIKLKPIYSQIYIEKRKTQGFGSRISKNTIFEDLEIRVAEQFDDFSLNNLSFDIQDITSFNVEDLEIIYQLIPSNTYDTIHLEIYKNTLPKIVPQLLKDRYQKHDDNFYNSNLYSLRQYIFRRFAYFILERNTNEIDTYLQPFIDFFDATEETAIFLDEIISAEDYNNRYEQFWYIWNKLYPKFVEVCNMYSKFHLNKIIRTYLLAWQWWREGITEWHSLKEENLSFYTNVAKELGHNPNVLYSISKVLNSIGSKFLDNGINWIYTIVSENKTLELGDLESNTLYYLEKLMRKFIFSNGKKIRQELKLKNKIILILKFIIERGSVHGYLLRENIL